MNHLRFQKPHSNSRKKCIYIVKWCAAPADAPEDELRRIFSIVDEPESDDTAVWFYSSLEDIGRKPFDVALLERTGKGTRPTIMRPT